MGYGFRKDGRCKRCLGTGSIQVSPGSSGVIQCPTCKGIGKATDRRARLHKALDRALDARELSVPEKHQLRIAKQTLKYSDAGARIMGPPSKEEARAIILRLTGRPAKEEAEDAVLNYATPPKKPRPLLSFANPEDVKKMTAKGGSMLHKAKDAGDVRIVYNKLLGGWYVVRGSHQTPLSGRFNSKEEAQASLQRGHDASPFDRDTDAGSALQILSETKLSPEKIAAKYGYDLRFVKEVLAGKYGKTKVELKKALDAEVKPV